MGIFLEVSTKKEAVTMATWACKIIKVSGGYLAFEYETDYNVWKQQR